MVNMPKLTTPPMPEEIADAISMVGSPTRVAIIKFLRDHHSASASDLSSRLNLNLQTVKLNLRALEELGAIAGTPPQGKRTGKAVTYSPNGAYIDKALTRLTHYLSTT